MNYNIKEKQVINDAKTVKQRAKTETDRARRAVLYYIDENMHLVTSNFIFYICTSISHMQHRICVLHHAHG